MRTKDGRDEPSARPTMVDVAKAAGVSLKTVSRVVNGEAGVRDATAERVRAVIDRLGYRRNEVARSLRPGQHSSAVGLVIADIANPFYSVIARAVEETATGYRVIIASTAEDPERERSLVAELVSRRVDGLIVVPSGGDHAFLEAELRGGTSIVLLDRAPKGLTADAVLIDNRAGARRGVAHLLERGHRRIAFVGDPPEVASTSGERLEGYRDALAAASVPFDEALVRLGPRDTVAADRAATELLAAAEAPTAVFTGNNRSTIGVLRAIRRLASPAALVGFDDFELADLVEPPVTVVSYDVSRMGTRAAELLLDRIAGSTGPAVVESIPTTLVERGSGERPPR